MIRSILIQIVQNVMKKLWWKDLFSCTAARPMGNSVWSKSLHQTFTTFDAQNEIPTPRLVFENPKSSRIDLSNLDYFGFSKARLDVSSSFWVTKVVNVWWSDTDQMLLPIGLAFVPAKYWPETFFHESYLFLKQKGDIGFD